MSISFPYSIDYHPSAPTLEVAIKAKDLLNLEALLDTGADATMIPLDLLNRIGATFLHNSRIYGATGHSVSADIYLVEVKIGNHWIPGIYAAGITANTEPIIGRDVLNQLIVTLDGISGITEIS